MKNRKDDVKAAIARIFAAIINADGVLSASELQHLEKKVMPKYDLKMEDFEEHYFNFTFAEAINLTLSSGGIRYLERVGVTPNSLYEDMLKLAQADGSVHPKEALLCLSFRLALNGNDFLSLVSLKNQVLRFSRQEIIFVESETNDDINKEISDNYDVIRYMLQSFGLRFVYIPRVRESFCDYPPEYKIQLIKYYFPERFEAMNEDDILTQFNYKLQTDIDGSSVTQSFCKMLFENGANEIPPSFLIKINSTQKRNPNGLTDFVMLRINDKGALHSMKEFLRKFDDLCERNDVLIQRGNVPVEFNSKSFDKTFLEYLFSRVAIINVHVMETAVVFCFNDLDKVKMSNGLVPALYLTELYCSLVYGGFVNATQVNGVEDIDRRARMEKQYELFNRIYLKLNGDVYNREEFINHERKSVPVSFEVFYAEFTKNHRKISDMLGSDEYRGMQHLREFFPQYDKNSKSVRIPPKACYVYNDRKKNESEEISLFSWVEGLK